MVEVQFNTPPPRRTDYASASGAIIVAIWLLVLMWVGGAF